MSRVETGQITSKDGTTIVFDRTGEGPPLILVGGALNNRASGAPYAEPLAPSFTVYTYDRRGRGDSGDTQPYAVEREVEDLGALIAEAGGSALLFGHSSGAAIVLETAARIGGIVKIALYEPPYNVDDTRAPVPDDYVAHLDELVAQDRRGDAVEYFMAKVVGMPEEFVASARSQPWWQWTESLAHTLAYDAEIMGDYSLPVDAIRNVAVPTLVLVGAASFDFFGPTAKAIVDALPDARVESLEGQEHNVDPTVLGPALAAFFAS